MAESKRINRSVYGQYGLAQIEGYEVPYLSASKAEQLAQPGERFFDASHGRGNIIADLGWSGNSFSNALARGAAAFGIEKKPVEYDPERFSWQRLGLNGMPDVVDYQITGDLKAVADKFGIDTSNLQPYQEEVKGNVFKSDGDDGNYVYYERGTIQKPKKDSYGETIGYEPLTRTVSVDEQIYNKINEATKDYYSYTGDTLVPGQAGEGSPNSFQTVLYKKEGDVLKPITKPIEHGGWQNADVYTGGGGFKLSEFIRGIAPVVALPFAGMGIESLLANAASAGGAAAGTAAGGAGATGATASGFVGLTPAYAAELGLVGGSGLSSAGAAGNVLAGIYGAGAAPGFVGLTPEYAAELGLSGGSGLSSAGTSGNVLAGIYGAGEGAAFGMSDELAAELGLSGGSGLDTAGAAGDPLAGIYGASKPFITPGMALQGARLGMGLLSGGQQQQQQQQTQITRQNIMPRGQVDYSGLLGLITPRMVTRNPNSLLG